MDNYEVLLFISRGSFGKVYKVKSKLTNNIHALKKIDLNMTDKYQKESIITELKILAFHDNPYLLGVTDIFVENSELHIITPFANRIDIGNYIKQYNKKHLKINEMKIWKILCQMLLSIDYLHNYSIIHRDIKAKNVLFCENYEILIGDFGVSKILSPTKIHTNTQIGTPYYLSPEMVKGGRYTVATDIWAIGCVLYELMFGSVPYQANNIYQLYMKIKNNMIIIPSTTYSDDLKLILKDLLTKNEYTRPSIKNLLSRNSIKEKIRYFGLVSNKNTNVHREFFLQKNIKLPNTTIDWKNCIVKLLNDKNELETIIKNQTLNIKPCVSKKTSNLPSLKPTTPPVNLNYHNPSHYKPIITPVLIPINKPNLRPIQNRPIPTPISVPLRTPSPILDYNKKLPKIKTPSYLCKSPASYLMPCMRNKYINIPVVKNKSDSKDLISNKYPVPVDYQDKNPPKFFY